MLSGFSSVLYINNRTVIWKIRKWRILFSFMTCWLLVFVFQMAKTSNVFLLICSVGEIQKADLFRRITVNSNGMLLWLFPAQLESACVYKKKNGKYDCRLKFASWTYNGLQLNLTHTDRQLGMSNFYPNPDYEIMGTNSTLNLMRYACCPEPYPDVSYQLSFKGVGKG